MGDSIPFGAGDEHTVPPSYDRVLERCVAVKDAVDRHDALGHGQQRAVKTDKAARRAAKLRAASVPPGRPQLNQLRTPLRQARSPPHRRTRRPFDLDFLVRLVLRAAFRVLAHEHPRATDREFEALAAHRISITLEPWSMLVHHS